MQSADEDAHRYLAGIVDCNPHTGAYFYGNQTGFCHQHARRSDQHSISCYRNPHTRSGNCHPHPQAAFANTYKISMNATPGWVLTLFYWLHMLATVVWIGGLVSLGVFVLPAARKSLDEAAYSKFLTQLVAGLQRIGWFCLGVLIVTGMFQLSAHPQYQGFLAITTPWASALFIKHLVIGGMIAVSAYISWWLLPALNRLSLMRQGSQPGREAELESLRKRETFLLKLNLVLAVIVLLLTAWARAS